MGQLVDVLDTAARKRTFNAKTMLWIVLWLAIVFVFITRSGFITGLSSSLRG